jgi:CRISPR-associated protein Csd1
MTILQALCGYYDRLAATAAAPQLGYSVENISFVIILSSDGRVVDVRDVRDNQGKTPRPSQYTVPQPPKRTSGVDSKFLWDNTSYVFGVTTPDMTVSEAKTARGMERMAKEHSAFKELHEKLLADSKDKGLHALYLFLKSWRPATYPTLRYHDDMIDQNVIFQLDGEHGYVHERPAARTLVSERLASSDAQRNLCLVSGKMAAIARLHPSIKGVRNAQSSGASIFSFNKDAFISFGKKNNDGANAPVSEAATFAYTTALNTLIAAKRGTDAKGKPIWQNRVQIGDATTLFWAEVPPNADPSALNEAELMIGALIDPPSSASEENAKLRDALAKIEAGRPVEEAAPSLHAQTRAYVLGLAPNAARISIRFWLDRTLGELAENIGMHWRHLAIEPKPWKVPPTAWRLLSQLAPLRRKPNGQLQAEAEHVPNHLAGELTRAILTGGAYPLPLLTMCLCRLRADREVTPLRVAMIKASLCRRNKEVPVALDRNEFNTGYRLGRLFAVLEDAQRAGVGKVNAGIRDKYVGAASATPRRVFPLLLRGTQSHLSAAHKKARGGWATNLEKEMSQIMGGLSAAAPFPATLSIDDQGRFFVGYYHQQSDLFTKAPPKVGADVPDDSDDTDSED